MSVILERIFSIPGMGSYLLASLNSRDYPVVQGAILLTGLSFILIQLVVDISYSYLDPRVQRS